MNNEILERYGLARDPFGTEPDPSRFHPTRAHSSALEELGGAVRAHKPLVLLQGPDGAGKTMVLRSLARELPERFQLVVVERDSRRLGGLYTAIADALGLSGDRERDCRRAVEEHVAERAAAGNSTAIAIDDAQSLPDYWVEQIASLTGPETISVVVACAGVLAGTSRRPEATALRGRVVETVRLRPVLESECSGYLQALLMAAGAREARLFDDEAVATLHELSGGLPGRIASIAGRAMTLAATRGDRVVGEELVLAAAEELSGPKPAPPLRPIRESAATTVGESFDDDPARPQVIASAGVEDDEIDRAMVDRMPAAAAGGSGSSYPYALQAFDDSHGPSRWSSGEGTGNASTRSTAPPVPSARATETRPHAGPRPVDGGGSAAPAVTVPQPPPGQPPIHIPTGVDADVRRQILAGVRRPDRPAWDRSKTDPFRVAGPAEAPFGPDMLPVIADPHGDAAEWFRMVRMGLEEWMEQRGEGSHSVMVSSAEAEAGKTFVAVNLALLFANEPGLRVLIVDGDLRRPRFEALFGLPARPGLADVIAGRAELADSMQYVSEVGLYVLPGGRAGNPRDLVSPERLMPVIAEAKAHVDLVILDSPPMHGGVDARAMAASVDGVMFVARAGRTRAPELARAMRSLDRKNLIGAVVTGVQGQRAERGRGDRSRRR